MYLHQTEGWLGGKVVGASFSSSISSMTGVGVFFFEQSFASISIFHSNSFNAASNQQKLGIGNIQPLGVVKGESSFVHRATP